MVLPWLAAAWVVGIALGPSAALPLWQWTTLSLISAVAAWSTRRESRLGWAFLALACLFLGAWRAESAVGRRADASVAAFIRPAAQLDLTGSVLSRPRPWGEFFVFTMRAEAVSAAETASASPVSGVVLVVTEESTAVARGERLLARGRLRRPAAGEDRTASAVLETASLRSLSPPPRWHPIVLLDRLRGHLVDRLEHVLPAAEASLVSGVLFGADEEMPEAVRQAFRDTGTAHILAVSGFNVTIVAAAAASVFGAAFGARRGAIAAGAAILLYTLLCGAEAAVVRAAIMAVLALLALRLGRQSAAISSVAAAAILMTLQEPAVVFDVGFQLSFLATLGLIVAGRPSQETVRRWGDRAIRFDPLRAPVVLIVELAVLSLVAQAATLPLSAYVFHRLPLTSLPANALILPAQPLLMATGAATAFASLISLPLGRLVAWLAWPAAAYTLRVAELFADLPGASLSLPPFAGAGVALAYAAMIGAVLAAKSTRVRSAAAAIVRVGGPAWLAALFALTAAAWRTAGERPDGRLSVTAFPSGSLLMETPTGRFVALVPGRGAPGRAESLESQLPLSHRRLDWLVVTDTEATTVPSLTPPPQILLIGDAAGAAMAAEGSPPSVRGGVGTSLDLGGGARLVVVEAAEGTATLRLTHGSASIAILICQPPAGCRSSPTAASAEILLGDGRAVLRRLEGDTVLPGAWVRVAAPLPGERFTPLPQAGPPLLAAPVHGWIRLVTDGRRLEVRAERPP